MGLCASKHGRRVVVPVADVDIESSIKKDKDQSHNEVKLLLLGSGESGKSTIFRQLKIIHNNGFSTVERTAYVALVRRHCVENFCDLIAGAQKLSLLTEEQKSQFEDILQSADSTGLKRADVTALQGAWNSPALQAAFKQRVHFQITDWAEYFFSELPRISSPDYIPTDLDILRCRIRTTGVSELVFDARGVTFRLVDVGGQRNERRKWIHCFDGVQAVLFVGAISEYDQAILEDDRTNRLTETLRLFQEICSTRFFQHTPIILFLNKKDIFEQKLSQSPLSACFPEYDGGANYDLAVKFLVQQFRQKSGVDHDLYTHVTCAVSTDNINFVFSAVRDSIMTDNLTYSGFV
eukprot:c6642_g1_i1.p1 GENE.c6642_g1_i1~~c6642_g1_i1.p1  ORF type:complete len:350 (-),score=69.63 c6642_g1_i1:281-1330(-)